MLTSSMACRYVLCTGSDYRDGAALKSYFTRSFITSPVQPFFYFAVLCKIRLKLKSRYFFTSLTNESQKTLEELA